MEAKNYVGDTTYTKISVSGLPWQTQEDTVQRYFEQFGEIQEVAVIVDEATGRSKGYGYVIFKDPSAAERACEDPSPLIDGKRADCIRANLGTLNSTSIPYDNSKISQDMLDNFLNPFVDTMYSSRDLLNEKSWTCSNVKTTMPIKIREMAKAIQCGEARDKNFVFSPSSIQLALSLVANGSNSSTLDEFLKFLEVEDLNQLNSDATKHIDSLIGGGPGPILSFVGGLWVDNSLTLSSTFREKAEKIYGAQAKALDFHNNLQEAILEVNRWAEEASNGIIKSILPEDLDKSTVIVLGNALYFKGLWSRKFHKKSTREYSFYLSDQTKTRELLDEPSYASVTVPFMTSSKPQYITSFEKFKVLRLPYEKKSGLLLSMYIILPNQVEGIWHLIDMVGSDPLFFDTHIRSNGSEVVVREFRIPKFKMSCDFEASDVLRGLGLQEPFSSKAKFDEMVPNLKPGDITVSKVFHKAQIEVNEEGTEAATVTAITMTTQGSASYRAPTPVDFIADHPFMFMVREDQTGIVLFMGHVMNPLL